MHKVVMPRIDPGMQTGFLVQWLKKEGDRVEKSEPVAIGEGEKTTFDIVAPGSGILRRQLYPEKSEVEVTETIALIGEEGETVPEETLGEAQIQSPTKSIRDAKGEAPKHEELQPQSPAARRLAREHNIDLSNVRGTGPGGRVTREDVQRLLSITETAATSLSGESHLPRVRQESRLSATRKTIAERLTYSHKTVPSASIMMDVKMDPLLELMKRTDASNRSVSLTAIFVKALAQALSEDPILNSSLEGDVLRTYEDVNVAVAIQTPEGLVAPTIYQANNKPLLQISEEIRLLTGKAYSRSLTIEELTGSTVTLSNLGPQGVDAFIPIINPPNAVILGVGRIAQRPEVVDGKITNFDSAATLTLVFDHRVGDGVAAARLLSKVKQLLEAPENLAE